MIKGLESVTLFSESPAKLANFYKEKVGIEFGLEAELGEGEDLFGFEPKEGSGFYIVHHSDIKGKTKEPKRVIINFEVDDIEKEFEKLKGAGVKVIADIYHIQDYGYIATFEDLDGNYFQLVKTKA